MMADAVDMANDIVAEHLARGIAAARAAPFDAGAPGACDWCGEDVARVVEGLCAPCRDRRWRHG